MNQQVLTNIEALLNLVLRQLAAEKSTYAITDNPNQVLLNRTGELCSILVKTLIEFDNLKVMNRRIGKK